MTTENTTGRSRRGAKLSDAMALAAAHPGDRPADVFLWVNRPGFVGGSNS